MGSSGSPEAVRAMYRGLHEIHERLKAEGVQDPFTEAMHLFDLFSQGAVRRVDRTIRDHGEECVALIERRASGSTPMEFILGRAVFMGREFFCTPDTLIPTEHTSLLVNVVAEQARPIGRPPRILEIGTGCGNIAVSVALELEDATVLASDISEAAVAVARRNVDRYGLGDRVSLFCGDLFAPFEGLGIRGAVDVVVSNPPYIPTTSLARLPSEIVDHEPLVALDGGPYGIDVYRRLIAGAGAFLAPGGLLVFEIGERQERLVERLFAKSSGYQDVTFLREDDKVRAMGARRKPEEVRHAGQE
jgi:release factor-specific protein-(glutamine-N5) methyltransferase